MIGRVDERVNRLGAFGCVSEEACVDRVCHETCIDRVCHDRSVPLSLASSAIFSWSLAEIPIMILGGRFLSCSS